MLKSPDSAIEFGLFCVCMELFSICFVLTSGMGVIGRRVEEIVKVHLLSENSLGCSSFAVLCGCKSCAGSKK